MRVFASAILILCLLGDPVRADQFQECLSRSLPGHTVRELSDERLRVISARVLAKANLSPYDFSLCEYDGFVPLIVGLIQSSRLVAAVVLPTYVRSFSDTQAEGLIAHEMAHKTLFGVSIDGMRREIATDSQAAIWVGNETVAIALTRMIVEVERFPEHMHNALTAEWLHRIGILRQRVASQR